MNITVLGSTDLTLSVLNFLHDHSYKINAIITTPEVFKISYQPTGVINSRFVNLSEWAIERNIPFIIYENADKTIEFLKNKKIETEFAIVAGWYHMIPKKLRDIFSFGCSGFHASLLPKLRGGAPLNWAILSDLKETGVSFFELSDGVDDGLLYDQEKFLIKPKDNIGDLVKKSQIATLNILKRTLPKILMGENILFKQVGTPSYCGQRKPHDSLIDWKNSDKDIIRLIKASSKPYSGAYSFLDEVKVTIWDACTSNIKIYGTPGQILLINKLPYVICGKGSLLLRKVGEPEILNRSNNKRFQNAIS